MSVIGQNQFYAFRMQEFDKLREAISVLLNKKEALVTAGIPAAEKACEYAVELQKILASEDKKNILNTAEKELVRFLDADIIAQFIATPEDETAKENLYYQLALVSSATGNMPGVSPFTKKELSDALEKGGDAYDDTSFLITLNSLMGQTDDAEVGKMLADSLPAVSSQEDLLKLYFWNEALMFASVLHIIWASYQNLDPAIRSFLLRNYFYSAIVMGVPVRFLLQNYLKNKGETDLNIAIDAILKDLDKNSESIPLGIEDEEGVAFTVFLKQTISNVHSGEVETLESERFLDEMYSDEEDAEFYTVWAREVLLIILHLRKGDILEV